MTVYTHIHVKVIFFSISDVDALKISVPLGPCCPLFPESTEGWLDSHIGLTDPLLLIWTIRLLPLIQGLVLSWQALWWESKNSFLIVSKYSLCMQDLQSLEAGVYIGKQSDDQSTSTNLSFCLMLCVFYFVTHLAVSVLGPSLSTPVSFLPVWLPIPPWCVSPVSH